MRTFDSFVGLPWRERGRSRDGLDCWGLAVEVYRDLLGVGLPSLADEYDNTADSQAIESLIDGGRGAWEPVAAGSERRFDLILFREHPWHIGVVVRRGWMLHMPREKTSVIEQFTTGRHARRVEGLYRHISKI